MRFFFTSCISIFVFLNTLSAQNTIFDGAKKYQTIHGFGVNINPQLWNINPEAVKEVIDSLITGMGCTSFHAGINGFLWNKTPGTFHTVHHAFAGK